MAIARGSFAVRLNPLPAYNDDADARLARLSIDKTFSGDLAGMSKGEMLSAGSAVDGSAGYVAIERVTATLVGRQGAFTLQHSGTMTRGHGQLALTVVPDSGSGELAGLAGTMQIVIENGAHYYVFEYTFGDDVP
jgi:hypothetical protein